jgi:23S rRNA (pseudouridine1915-N3)-methyltransferase
MKIEIISIGKPDVGINKLINEYLIKIKHFVDIKYLPQKDIKNKNIDLKIQQEEKLILSSIEKGFICVLDEKGVAFDSRNFAGFIQKQCENTKNLYFVIGGAFGINDNLRKKADKLLRISDFTLQHDIALLVLCEQIYRAFTILNNIPYHK